MYIIEYVRRVEGGMRAVDVEMDIRSFRQYFNKDINTGSGEKFTFLNSDSVRVEIVSESGWGSVHVLLTVPEDKFNDNFFQCDVCRNWYFTNTAHHQINGKTVCCKCTTVCVQCGEPVILNDAHYYNGQYYCDSCFDEMELIYCDECGDYVQSYCAEDKGWIVDSGECLCSDCASQRYPIHSYHARRHYTYHSCEHGVRRKVSEEGPYLGFELETDNDDMYHQPHAIKAVYSCFGGYFDCQHDGSLCNGIELISEPATAKYHNRLVGRYSDLFSDLVDLGYRSHNTRTCGLHVHIDREWFGDKEDIVIAKMLYIFSKFESEIIKFSRRDRDEYERWSAPRYRKRGWIKEAVKDDCGGRYHNINLENTHTIEIRVFKGTLKAETVIATINFVDRICKLCRDTSSTQIAKMSWEEILGDDEYIVNYWETRRGN